VRTVMAETAEMRITVARESGLWAFTHLQWELEDVEVRERGEHNLQRLHVSSVLTVRESAE
jgi:hypothetical protein